MTNKKIRIGTRKSDLALAQAEEVKNNLLKNFPEYSFEIVPAETTGDIRRDKLNLNVQDKKQWIIELEKLLIEQEIDIAVHSAKDVPIQLQKGTEVCSILKRERAEDILILNKFNSENKKINLSNNNPIPLSELKLGGVVGTSSNRRRSQLLRTRPDLEIVECRGNVPTRISKLSKENLDGIVIALAGVMRLKIDTEHYLIIENDLMVPASGQGTLLAQYRIDDNECINMLSSLIDANTQIEFESERRCIDILGADCHSCIGVKATVNKEKIFMNSRVLSKDGLDTIEAEIEGNTKEHIKLANELAEILISKGALRIL